MRLCIRAAALACAALPALLSIAPAMADDEIETSVTIRDHKFEPAEVKIPAGKSVKLTVNNLDATAEEFESYPLGFEKVIAGNIIVRQCGTKWHPGNNVGLGRDYTIYSLIDGIVKFEHKSKTRQKVSVYPVQRPAEVSIDAPASV